MQHVPSGDVIVLDDAENAHTLAAPLDVRAAHARFGMGASIAAGVSARSGASGWLVMPGDMPLLLPSTLQRVAQALASHRWPMRSTRVDAGIRWASAPSCTRS